MLINDPAGPLPARPLDSSARPDPVSLRSRVRPGDESLVRSLSAASGLFNPGEIDLAGELVQERLAKGPASGYHFIIAEVLGKPVGYTCFGPIPLTRFSYDLYWIAVAREHQGLGYGRRLLAEVEARVGEWGGTRIYAETSGRPDYLPTRGFYLSQGFREAAVLTDFYDLGEAKVVYLKILDPAAKGTSGLGD